MTYFEALNLPESLTIDAKDLEARFYAESRKWHPDRFARASADDQQRALDQSSILNDAYRTLRDPAARASYVLKLHGIELGESRKQDVPPELLEEVFELNMALEELAMGDTDVVPQLREADRKFRSMLSEIDTELAQISAGWDADHDPEHLARVKSAMQRRKYVKNLVRDTEKALETHVPN